MNKPEIFIKAIEKWGAKSQYEMAQEEATELALAVRKHIRNNNEKTFSDLAGEIADVQIMIEQIYIMNPTMERKSARIYKQKIERLERRVNENDFEGK